MIRTRSPALFGLINEKTVSDALDYASSYSIESWDGVLVALCRSLGSTIIYCLDQDLNKVKEITIVNPFQEEKVQKYHEYINSLIG
jgi:predicted nucleic acid-binding protein